MATLITKSIDVYSIGNPLIDILAHVKDRDIERLGLEKGTMTLIDTEKGNEILDYIKDLDKIYSCGGSAPNTMVTMSALGIKTVLAGMVGNDDLGKIYDTRLQEKNVHSNLSKCTVETGSCIVLVTPDYERTMSTRLGACREFSPANVNHDIISRSSYIYFTGYMWDTENQKNALTDALKTARRSKTTVVFDLADPFVVERNRSDFLRLVEESVDIILANREETRLLLGFDDPERAARELAAKEVLAAVKNCAEGSCIASTGKKVLEVDAYSVDAVDSTGAGDNYAAGFLYGLIKGYKLLDAGKIASYVAAQIVRQTGAQFDEDTARRIKEYLEEGKWQ